MKWIIEISDNPDNIDYPITAYQVFDNDTRKGPFLLKSKDVVEALTVGPLEGNHAYSDENINNELRTPILPRNCINYSVDSEKEYDRITMVIEKGLWFVSYHGRKNDKKIDLVEIPFPRLIVQYVLKKVSNSTARNIKKTRIFAIKDNHAVIDESTPLYYFPFPNVAKESGNVCWGQNSFTIPSISHLERFFSQFVAAPFNDDYGISLDISEQRIGNFSDYIEFVTSQNVSIFEDSWLLPANQTVSNLLSPKTFLG